MSDASRDLPAAPVEATYVAWYELTLAALSAITVGLVSPVALGAISVRRFTLSAAGALAVFLAASAGFFL